MSVVDVSPRVSGGCMGYQVRCMLDSARRWRVWGPWDVVLLASLTGSLQLPLGCFSAEGEAAGMRNSCSESEKGWSARSGLARIFCLQHVMLTSLSRLIDRLVWRLELVRCSEGGGVDVLVPALSGNR